MRGCAQERVAKNPKWKQKSDKAEDLLRMNYT